MLPQITIHYLTKIPVPGVRNLSSSCLSQGSTDLQNNIANNLWLEKSQSSHKCSPESITVFSHMVLFPSTAQIRQPFPVLRVQYSLNYFLLHFRRNNILYQFYRNNQTQKSCYTSQTVTCLDSSPLLACLYSSLTRLRYVTSAFFPIIT